jgi:hypothetical protein
VVYLVTYIVDLWNQDAGSTYLRAWLVGWGLWESVVIAKRCRSAPAFYSRMSYVRAWLLTAFPVISLAILLRPLYANCYLTLTLYLPTWPVWGLFLCFGTALALFPSLAYKASRALMALLRTDKFPHVEFPAMEADLAVQIRSVQVEARVFLRRRLPKWRSVWDLGHEGRCAHVANNCFGLCPSLGRTIEVDPLVAYRAWQGGDPVIRGYGDDFAAVYRYIIWHEIGHAVHQRAVRRLGWRKMWSDWRRRSREQSHHDRMAREMTPAARSRHYHQSIRQERVANRFASWATGLHPFATK